MDIRRGDGFLAGMALPAPSPLAAKIMIFNMVWAIAHICHVVRRGFWEISLAWVLLYVAVLLLLRPGSQLVLGLLAATQMVFLFFSMPFTDNHLYLMGFINAALLVTVFSNFAKGRAREIESLAPVLPCLCGIFLLAYGAAAVAKLNPAFFNVEWSCAVELARKAAAVFGDGVVPPLWVESGTPYLVAGAELAIPLLLLLPGAWRMAGIVVGAGFHYLVSLSPTSAALHFTVVVMALLFLFLPSRVMPFVWERGTVLLARVRGQCGPVLRRTGLLLVVLLPGVFFATGLGTVAGGNNWLPLILVATGLGALLCWLAWRAAATDGREPLGFGAMQARYYVVLAVVLLNAACPYLGIKHQGTFTMYSNLRTTGMVSNHFFLPRLPVRTGMDDVVEIVESTNGRLLWMRDRGFLITTHELRRVLARDPLAQVTYIRNGELVEVPAPAATHAPELVRVHPIWHRLVAFRLFHPQKPGCQW